jgi:arsenate reductase
MSSQKVRIYHNPKCSKSREALALLRAQGVDPEVVLYLERGLARDELVELAEKLRVPAHELLRSKEEAYVSLRLSPASAVEDVLGALVSHPILLERPLVVVGERAVIGRPPERVLELPLT